MTERSGDTAFRRRKRLPKRRGAVASRRAPKGFGCGSTALRPSRLCSLLQGTRDRRDATDAEVHGPDGRLKLEAAALHETHRRFGDDRRWERPAKAIYKRRRIGGEWPWFMIVKAGPIGEGGFPQTALLPPLAAEDSSKPTDSICCPASRRAGRRDQRGVDRRERIPPSARAGSGRARRGLPAH